MTDYPELDKAAERAAHVLPMCIAEVIADHLLDDEARRTNDLRGLRYMAEEVMGLPLPVITEPAGPQPMPFDLWWSPSLRRFLSRHENQDDEHLVWVFHGHHEALPHYLGTGADSNPPLPDDAVRLVLADPEQGSELERLRAQVERQHETNAGWVAYKDRKKTERFRNIEAFEDALGLERAGRGYWYERMIEAAAKVRAERDRLQARVAEQDQVLAIVRAQNEDCVEQVDAALGHRYHTPGVHYSIPHVAEQAAVEIQRLQARIDKVLALHDPERGMEADPDGRCFECGEVMPCPTRAALLPVLPGDETPQPEEDQP